MSISDGSNKQTGTALGESNPAVEPTVTKPHLSTSVDTTNRHFSVDLLRGFAVLGILVINIIAMALPELALNNPNIAGGDSGLDLVTWAGSYLLFFQKFIPIFSMLFGAGLILMYNRAEKAGVEFRKIYYRRLRWLMIFGLVHAYFLWWGDILYAYAVLGMFLYLFRNLSPGKLISLAVIMIMVASTMYFGLGKLFEFASETAAEAQVVLDEGGTLTTTQEIMGEIWRETGKNFSPSPERLEEDISRYRGDYAGIFKARAANVIVLQTGGMLMFIGWFCAGMMFLGMGLMKLGVFTGERTHSFYRRLIYFGYGLGLPAVGYATYRLTTDDFIYLTEFTVSGPINYIACGLVALGHVGAVMLMHKNGVFSGLQARLAAVGRMALTNYLMHTILLTPIFYGYGLGYYSQLSRFELMGLVVIMWILQLYLSPLWLKHFRFGPAEWFWRLVTYRKRPPMRLE